MRILIAVVLAVGCSRPAPAPTPEPTPEDPVAAALAGGGFPRTTSVYAEQGGRVLAEAYAGGTGPETLHDPRSAMKSVTALAVGVAIAEGHLPSVDAPAFPLLADLAPFANDGPLKQAITLADFLTMSSALDCNDDIPASPGNEENMYPLRVWSRWAVDLPVKADYARDASGRGPFSYCTAGTFLLGQILARATGEPVDRFIESRLLAPLGITERYWPRSPTGEVMTGGGLRLRTRDLARLGRLVVDRGRWQERQVVPAAWIDQALTEHRQPDEMQDPKRELGYGYLFWRRAYTTPCGRVDGWYMSGNGGNHVVMIPELDTVAVVTTVNYNTRGMHPQTVRLLEEHVLPRLTCPAARR